MAELGLALPNYVLCPSQSSLDLGEWWHLPRCQHKQSRAQHGFSMLPECWHLRGLFSVANLYICRMLIWAKQTECAKGVGVRAALAAARLPCPGVCELIELGFANNPTDE